MAELLSHPVNDGHRLIDDLGTDSVSAERRGLELRLATPRAFREASRPPCSLMPLTNAGKGADWKVCPVVSSEMTPVAKSTDT